MSSDKSHIAWMHGSYHARRALMNRFREKFQGCETFSCDSDVTYEFLAVELQETGCFAEQKLVIINAMPKFKNSNKATHIKKFKEVLEGLDDNIFVIFNGIDPKKEKSLFDHVKKLGGKVYEFPDTLDKNAAPKWVKDQLEKRGYKIDFEVAEAIVETCGHDAAVNGIGADQLEMVIQKLAAYQGGRKQITLESVEATASSVENFIIWDLLNAIDAKDYERCINMISKAYLVDNNVPVAVSQMLSTLYWKFRLLWLLKDRAANEDMTAAAKTALQMPKLKGSGSGYSRKMEKQINQSGDNAGQPAQQWSKFVVQQAIEGAYGRQPSLSLYNRRDLYRIVRSLQTALICLRSISSESEALLIADTVFMTACNTAEDQQIRSIMRTFEEATV